jgi:hypothetical protein
MHMGVTCRLLQVAPASQSRRQCMSNEDLVTQFSSQRNSGRTYPPIGSGITQREWLDLDENKRAEILATHAERTP